MATATTNSRIQLERKKEIPRDNMVQLPCIHKNSENQCGQNIPPISGQTSSQTIQIAQNF